MTDDWMSRLVISLTIDECACDVLVFSVVVVDVCDGSGYNQPALFLEPVADAISFILLWRMVTGIAAGVSVRRFEERGVVGAGRRWTKKEGVDNEEDEYDDDDLLFFYHPMPYFCLHHHHRHRCFFC
jgi:hypothetical protein